jgi:hypothetical protein
MRFAGASTTHLVARDRAMVAAHAITTDAEDADGGETGWRLCGADEQTGRRVLWDLALAVRPFPPFNFLPRSQLTTYPTRPRPIPSPRTLFIATTLHLVWLDQILGADHLLDVHALGAFLARCQYKFSGIGKAPDEHPGGHPSREYPSFSFFSGFYTLSPRLQKINARFRRSISVDRSGGNHIARSGMETPPSTRLSMRRTRLRDGPRSTFPPLRPVSRNCSGRAGKPKKTV